MGKKHTISGYLGKSVETIHDEGILDHTLGRLQPIVTSLHTHLAQSSDNEEYTDIQDFDVTGKFAPAQKNEFQLKFCKLKMPGRKKAKLPFK